MQSLGWTGNYACPVAFVGRRRLSDGRYLTSKNKSPIELRTMNATNSSVLSIHLQGSSEEDWRQKP